MNWLGELIQKEISEKDTVLDIGCGTMNTYTNQDYERSTKKFKFIRMNKNTLKCYSLLGIDHFEDYLHKSKHYFPVIKWNVINTEIFVDDSFDVVLCLDILEHLSMPDAVFLIDQMKRIARKKVIIYTPSRFESNIESVEKAFDVEKTNPSQLHQSFISPKHLTEKGFTVSFPEPDKNTYGIWLK